jgi:trehalose 6-phosphate phosphatase
LRDRSGAVLLSDFDGTLAPIVSDPMTARPLPGVPDLLRRLAGQLTVVGVVSGRPAEFLATRLAGVGDGVHLVGLYGLEWVTGGAVHHLAEADPWYGPAAEAAAAARAEVPPGAGVEPKGPLLTLHWRNAPGAREWATTFAAKWSGRTGLVAQPGRMSIELHPPIEVDKGTVVERLAAGCSVATFAGDDTGDLAAFAALERVGAAGATVTKVAVADPESPSALVARADLVLPGPAAFVDLLQRLASAAG